MDDFNNPFYRLGAAMSKLTWFYDKHDVLIGCSYWMETTEEENRYRRKALKAKAQGIVLHDQMLNGKGLK
jgi:hypothetical protein